MGCSCTTQRLVTVNPMPQGPELWKAVAAAEVAQSLGVDAAKAMNADVPERRRRLSLGNLTANSDDSGNTWADLTDDGKNLLEKLSKTQIQSFMDAIKDDELTKRKYSIGSETDRRGRLVTAFSNKSIKFSGSKFDLSQEAMGFTCKKGLKPEAPNQDSFFIMKIEDEYSFYGVFDGHGKCGHDVSNFIKDYMPKLLLSQDCLSSDPVSALERTFNKTQYLIEQATKMGKLNASRSGSTCSVVLHAHKTNMLYTAHVGDSRVVMGQSRPQSDGPDWDAVDLTVDHRPNLPEEKARIEKAGGIVLFDGYHNYRIYAKHKRDHKGRPYPGLNMSRAMGDLAACYDAGLLALPQVNKRGVRLEYVVAPNIDEEEDDRPAMERYNSTSSESSTTSTVTVSTHALDPKAQKFMLLCSDGVWEMLSSRKAVNIVAAFEPEHAHAAADCLAQKAWQKWTQATKGSVVDDITALVIHLR